MILAPVLPEIGDFGTGFARNRCFYSILCQKPGFLTPGVVYIPGRLFGPGPNKWWGLKMWKNTVFYTILRPRNTHLGPDFGKWPF